MVSKYPGVLPAGWYIKWNTKTSLSLCFAGLVLINMYRYRTEATFLAEKGLSDESLKIMVNVRKWFLEEINGVNG